MLDGVMNAVHRLNPDSLQRYPDEAIQIVAGLNTEDIIELLHAQPAALAIRIWGSLSTEIAADVIEGLDNGLIKQLLSRTDPVRAARFMDFLKTENRHAHLSMLPPAKAKELEGLMVYPDDSAGSIMDPRFLTLHGYMTVRDALQRIRRHKPRFTRQLFVVDDQGRLEHMVEIQDMALSETGNTLRTLS